MKYRELQSILKEFRARGYVLRCKLNQKAEVLAAEYERITSVINNHAVTGTDLSLDNLSIVSEADIPINSYQTKVPKFNQQLDGGVRHIGIEFEFITKHPLSEIAHALSTSGYNVEYVGYSNEVRPGWYKLVDDGSIEEKGQYNYSGELVTPPLDLNNKEDMKTLKEILKFMRDYCECRVNSSCGTHVHLEAKDFNASQIIKYFKAWQSNEETFDKGQPESRKLDNCSYCTTLRNHNFSRCSSLTDLCKELGNGTLRIDGRYHKLNPYSFVKYGTLEVRHHSATMSFDKIIRYAKAQMKFMLNSI